MSLTYDGFDLTRYALVKLERPVGPSLRIETEQVPGRDGEIPVSIELDVLRIIAHCTLRRRYYHRWDRVRMELAAAFTKLGEHMLTLPDEPDLYRMATASLTDNVQMPLEPPVEFSVEFVCHDPVAYGDVHSVTVPSGGSVEFEVGGMFPAVGIGVVAASAVRNSSSGVWGVRFDEGDFMHVALPSISSRRVEIDADDRTVKVANATDMITLDSSWPKLEPGTHVARMDQGTGAATLTWIERYL